MNVLEFIDSSTFQNVNVLDFIDSSKFQNMSVLDIFNIIKFYNMNMLYLFTPTVFISDRTQHAAILWFLIGGYYMSFHSSMQCHATWKKGTANVNCLLKCGRQNVAYWCITVLGKQVLQCSKCVNLCEGNVSEGNKKGSRSL